MFFHLSKHTSLNHRSLVRSSPRSVEAGKDAGFTARFFKISSHWGVMQIIREMAFFSFGGPSLSGLKSTHRFSRTCTRHLGYED